MIHTALRLAPDSKIHEIGQSLFKTFLTLAQDLNFNLLKCLNERKLERRARTIRF